MDRVLKVPLPYLEHYPAEHTGERHGPQCTAVEAVGAVVTQHKIFLLAERQGKRNAALEHYRIAMSIFLGLIIAVYFQTALIDINSIARLCDYPSEKENYIED